MNDYLFLFSMTPVQAFIEQARKTQDLYAGSKILSHLCRTAIEVSGLKAEQVIFPSYNPESIDSGYGLPNRFLARLEANEDTLQASGHAVEKAVREEFRKMAETVILQHKRTCSEAEQAQIDTYLTINWVFVKIENGDYTTAYKQIERDLGAIKQVRMFEPFEEEPGRKCSLCGERNVKFYRSKETEHDHHRLKKEKLFTEDVFLFGYKDPNIQEKYLPEGEGLCAICFAKRGRYDEEFPSTTNFALMDSLTELRQQSDWNIPKRYYANLIFDFKNNNQEQIQKARHFLSEEEFDNSKKLFQKLKAYNVEISPYYAVLRFDADNMGKWLHGNDETIENLQDFHPQFSAELRAFAIKVAEYFQKHPERGRYVYIGGDDFLGFLSLRSMFTVMKDLRHTFDTIDVRQFTEEKPTFSASVVVAHYHTPLAEVLKWSRDMEKAAKQGNNEKDRFAIAILKRSGEIQKTIFKWNEQKSWTTDLFENIIGRISDEKFSGSFLNGLEVEFRKLLNQDGTYLEDLGLFTTEIKRLIKRSIIPKKTEMPEKALDDMTQDVTALFDRCAIAEHFLAALGIIDFLTRKVASL